MAKQRKKINKPKVRKPGPPKQKKAPIAKVTEKAKVATYQPYNGPVVTAVTYDLFKTPLDRANAKRRHEAHLKGETMYKAKTLIPEHNGVAAHYIWVDKFVQGPVNKEESKEIQDNDGGNNESVAPGEVSGVQGGSDSTESGRESAD